MNLSLSQSELNLIKDTIEKVSGQIITSDKNYFIEHRLNEFLKKENLEDPTRVLENIRADISGTFSKKLTEAFAIHESLFFRDTRAFEFLEKTIIPKLLYRRKLAKNIRIWSNGCAHGQEAYSVAILFDELKLQDFKINILATDFSSSALDYARIGHYTNFESMRGLSQERLNNYFFQTASGYVINDRIRRMVTFKEHNSLSPLDNTQHFDIIFARNMLIYFDIAQKKVAFTHIKNSLERDGYLILGASETPLGLQTDALLKQVGPCTFGYK